ncbi:hypothetical protein [Xanthomonas vasicola]|nr:hypothetical protein [Xanthomonas vasicola]MDO6949996.1 hypothetical protein [Xanthomonas vasicola]MDO6962047.1 hypothetical protein [Xanthomonas vasicola]MEB1776537.1 hypothetical protein [Xanthomonas campestris pv. campestris]MEB2216999.1 hypothetical protein [Xanthomonas campestris pv. campestris]
MITLQQRCDGRVLHLVGAAGIELARRTGATRATPQAMCAARFAD